MSYFCRALVDSGVLGRFAIEGKPMALGYLTHDQSMHGCGDGPAASHDELWLLCLPEFRAPQDRHQRPHGEGKLGWAQSPKNAECGLLPERVLVLIEWCTCRFGRLWFERKKRQNAFSDSLTPAGQGIGIESNTGIMMRDEKRKRQEGCRE
jgi:hypothetical protein